MHIAMEALARRTEEIDHQQHTITVCFKEAHSFLSNSRQNLHAEIQMAAQNQQGLASDLSVC